ALTGIVQARGAAAGPAEKSEGRPSRAALVRLAILGGQPWRRSVLPGQFRIEDFNTNKCARSEDFARLQPIDGDIHADCPVCRIYGRINPTDGPGKSLFTPRHPNATALPGGDFADVLLRAIHHSLQVVEVG